MTIDPTKDVQTVENHPRPVMLLYALGNDTPYGFVVFNITKTATDEFWLMTDENRPDIRNVPPPKPNPVLREAWIGLYRNGQTTSPHHTEEACRFDANNRAGNPLEIRRIAWMSDGSPVVGSEASHDRSEAAVPEEAPVCQYRNHAHLEQERDHWKAKAEALQAEVERQKPVVDAAVIWERHFSPPAGERLADVVRSYYTQQSPATVGDVLEGIRNRYSASASSKPVSRHCETCLHCSWPCCDLPLEAARECSSSGLSKWEPRHD